MITLIMINIIDVLEVIQLPHDFSTLELSVSGTSNKFAINPNKSPLFPKKCLRNDKNININVTIVAISVYPNQLPSILNNLVISLSTFSILINGTDNVLKKEI